eukprot:UN00475
MGLFDNSDVVDITKINNYWATRAKWYNMHNIPGGYKKMPFHPKLPPKPFNTIDDDRWVFRCVSPWEFHPEGDGFTFNHQRLRETNKIPRNGGSLPPGGKWTTGPEDVRLYFNDCGDLLMIYVDINDVSPKPAITNKVLNLNQIIPKQHLPYKSQPNCNRADYKDFTNGLYVNSERNDEMGKDYEKNWGILTHGGIGSSFGFTQAKLFIRCF